MYPVIRQPEYDFADESYADSYPNIHKYPATMLPQIGIKVLHDLNIKTGILFDPYCGSGSSFAAGLDIGIKRMFGYDVNPLARLISKARFTQIHPNNLYLYYDWIQKQILDLPKNGHLHDDSSKLSFFNGNYWFSESVLQALSVIDCFLKQIADQRVLQIFQVGFAETLRLCSYTRNGEFKLYRMKRDQMEAFNPDVYNIFINKIRFIIDIYENYYFPKLTGTKILIQDEISYPIKAYDVILTSPPYGDSRTTVAYGQFSRFANEWLAVDYARNVDTMLMGGRKSERIYRNSLITPIIMEIDGKSHKRALEVSSFYHDLSVSIEQVSRTVKSGGKAIYVVGNRRVKNIQLPTDQFIAEQFERNGWRHLVTYERIIGNKVMPSENSPTNKRGAKSSTMSQEFIVICEK